MRMVWTASTIQHVDPSQKTMCLPQIIVFVQQSFRRWYCECYQNVGLYKSQLNYYPHDECVETASGAVRATKKFAPR